MKKCVFFILFLLFVKQKEAKNLKENTLIKKLKKNNKISKQIHNTTVPYCKNYEYKLLLQYQNFVCLKNQKRKLFGYCVQIGIYNAKTKFLFYKLWLQFIVKKIGNGIKNYNLKKYL